MNLARHPTCRHPDREFVKLRCGIPLPCPHHTAILHPDKDPPTIEIPVTAEAAWSSRDKLADITEALS